MHVKSFAILTEIISSCTCWIEAENIKRSAERCAPGNEPNAAFTTGDFALNSGNNSDLFVDPTEPAKHETRHSKSFVENRLHTQPLHVIPAGLKAILESLFYLLLVCHDHTQVLTHGSRCRYIKLVGTGQRGVEHAGHAAMFGVNCLRE